MKPSQKQSRVRVKSESSRSRTAAPQKQRKSTGSGRGSNPRSRAALEKHKFKPGQSGNPGGRPKGQSLSALLRELLDEVQKNGKTLGESVSRALIAAAKRGNVKAFNAIADRVDGKVPNKIEGADGGPVKVEVVWVKKGIGGEGADE